MPQSKSEISLAGESRVWMFEDGFGPANSADYMGLMKLGDPTMSFGDVTRVEIPDPNRHNSFVRAATIQGAVENPTFSLMGRYPADLSTLLKVAKRRCELGIQAHFGKCRNPQDFSGGWEKILVFPGARVTSYSGENFGALGNDEQNPANETGELSADDMYEIGRMSFSELAGATVTREIVSMSVCDSVECGDCGSASDGCSKVFATMIGTGATPGTLPSLLYSSNSGSTWASSSISTLFSTENPDDSACIGGNIVVIARAGGLHYADITDVLNGVGVWAEQSSGFNMASGGPVAIWSVDARNTWVVGLGGYIYYVQDISLGAVVQNAGVATTQPLNDVHAFDSDNVVAVGNSNAVVKTVNGGSTWNTVTGPAAGVNLNAVWMKSPDVWLVGTANGQLWYTTNSGISWTRKSLPITLTNIFDIQFFDQVVGYMSVNRGAADGVIMRTIDGGNTWYVLPEGSGNIPDNDRINHIALCSSDANVLFGGGLGGDGSDGIIVKAD